MPAFSIIAASIVASMGITGLAATILSAVVGTALSMVVSRLINGNKGGGADASRQDPGTRVQAAPDTTNRIPVIYGEGYFASMMTDAYLHDENKWMTYVMVIGETHNQYARFQGTILNNVLTSTDISDGDSGTIMLGMTLTKDDGTVVGKVVEWLGGTYGGVGSYRVEGGVNVTNTMLTGDFPYTVKDIYWNDFRLEFENGDKTGKAILGKKYVENLPYDPVTGAKNTEDETDTNFKDHAEVYLYAGNSTNTRNIGITAKKAAYQRIATGTEWKAPTVPTGQRMEGLLFAVVKVKYNSEKGFTGVPNLTFNIRNDLDNPAVVLYDCLRSDRYGANVGNAAINAQSLGDFANFCNEMVSYVPYGSSNSTGLQKRYTINGLLDTGKSVKDNLDEICLNSGCWLAYDATSGQWRVVPKRGVEYKAAYPNRILPSIIPRFTDDNIVSGININSTRLEDLYNACEIEYFDNKVKDQRGYRIIEINSTERNYNEPDNSMRLTLNLCNSNVQAERIANIDLKQSRDDVMIQFQTTHYGLQAQAGDVIQVENTLYGWCAPSFPNGKYFRIMTAKETEGEDGSIGMDITALEYNTDVYADESISEFTTSSNIGIIPRSSSSNIPAPVVIIKQDGVNATGGVPNFKLQVQVPAKGGPFDEIQLWYSAGKDWAGVGGDLVFRGQADVDGSLAVTSWYGPAPVRSLTDSGVATEITGWNSKLALDAGVPDNTYVLQFGSVATSIYGNGKTGYYTLNQGSNEKTGIIVFSGTVNAAKGTGTVVDGVLTVSAGDMSKMGEQSLIVGGVENGVITSGKVVGDTLYIYETTAEIHAHADTGTILWGQGIKENTRIIKDNGDGSYKLNIAQPQSIDPIQVMKCYWPNIPRNTVVKSVSGNQYTLSNSFTITEPFSFRAKYAYPLEKTFQYLKSIKPDPGSTLLFDQYDLRDTFISALPANNLNEKYFVKARLGINGIYGPFSELGEVDLEPVTVYWDPDSASALNIKQELVKMDFGKFTIPRNGLWMMRTAMVLDNGSFNRPNGPTFNLDLGDLREENEIQSSDLVEEFLFDPDWTQQI